MPTILIVDDEALIRMLLADVLGDEGYDVVLASNGLEGLKHFAPHCPHLVISDYMMPKLDGVALLKALRDHHSCHQVPFILMSALPPLGLSKSVAGYSAIIKKPFLPGELIKLVSNILHPTF